MTFDEAYFDAGIDRRNTQCEKWDDRSVMAAGGVPLWVADMDFPCAPAVMDAVRGRGEHACFGYNSEAAEAACTDALIAFWRRRHGLAVKKEQCVALPCVITGLKLCVRALTAPGDAVAMFTPVYGPFYQAVALNGRKAAGVPLTADGDGRYSMNLAGMERALRDGAKLILLCNPHNPVSRCWTREELTALAALAERYGVRIVSDEIHADFVYAPARFTPLLSVEGAANRAVMLCSASKTFNIAGLQQAAAVIPDGELREKLRADMAAAGVVCGNTFALAATRAAYAACDGWLDGLLRYLDGSRALLGEWIAEALPLARMAPIEATYLAWLDLKAYGKDCRAMAEKCRVHGVALTPGTFFGPEGEGCMRVNFACPRGMLKEGVRRLRAAMEDR